MTDKEESALVSWITICAHTGFPVGKRIIKARAAALLALRGARFQTHDGSPSDRWWRRFRRSNPQLKLRVPKPVPVSRALLSAADLTDMHARLRSVIYKEGREPITADRIWNLDETVSDPVVLL